MPNPPKDYLEPPALWVPVTGKVSVRLPFDPTDISANYRWLKDEAFGDDRVQVGQSKTSRGTWLIARARADELLAALQRKYGVGNINLLVDAATQRKCGESCQMGKPENALKCECQCGGENHGGVSGAWIMRGSFSISTEHWRRAFKV